MVGCSLEMMIFKGVGVSTSLDTIMQADGASSAPTPPAPSAGTDSKTTMQIVDGKFADYRWTNGAWDLESESFKSKDGKKNWDLVSVALHTLRGNYTDRLPVTNRALPAAMPGHRC